MDEAASAPELARTAGERTANLLDILRNLDPGELAARSQLPGWSRLTIVCHLRYGARALLRMTRDTLAGRETAYYPEGRFNQRDATLVPGTGETPSTVLDDWEAAAVALDAEWSAMSPAQWATEIVEPADNRDLGPVPLARLALARLTEVEVHGTDLAVAAPDWSPVLVAVALPTRLAWLATRRTNHRAVDSSVRGSWILQADEGLRWFLAIEANADGDGEQARDAVVSRPAVDGDVATATISGSGRDLLALLLGRDRRQPLRFGGDVDHAAAFERAFPGP